MLTAFKNGWMQFHWTWFHKTPNMYPNLSANTSNEQQFRLKKKIKSNIVLLQRLEREKTSEQKS